MKSGGWDGARTQSQPRQGACVRPVEAPGASPAGPRAANACARPAGHQKQRGLPRVGALLPGDVLLLTALPGLVRQLAASVVPGVEQQWPGSAGAAWGEGRGDCSRGTPGPGVLSPFSSRKPVNTNGKWSVAVVGGGGRLPLPPRASERTRGGYTKDGHVSVLLRLPAARASDAASLPAEKRLCLVSVRNVTAT